MLPEQDHGVRTWRRAGRDALPVLAVFAACPVVALLAPHDPTVALARGRELVHLERSLGVLLEPAANRWAAAHGLLFAVLTWAYLLVHVPATVGALVWTWLERRSAFARGCLALVLCQALVVAGYLVAPTAPPHMLGELGMRTGLGASDGERAGLAGLLQSPYAAVPSGHVAFAVVAAWVVASAARPLAVRLLAVLYPVVVVVVVVLTGNHLLADVALGAGAALGAVTTATLAVRLRPRRARRPARAGTRASALRAT